MIVEDNRACLRRLESKRLVLRAVAGSDRENLYAVHRDPNVSRLLVDKETMTRAHSDRLLQQYIMQWAMFDFGFYLVFEKGREAGTPLGRCGLRMTSQKEVELGYCFTAAASGRGLATEAASLVARHAFQALKVDRLIAFVRPSNRRSLRVVAKLGFRKTSIVDKPRTFYRFELTTPPSSD